MADVRSENSTVLGSCALDSEVEMNTVEKVAVTDEGSVKNDDATRELFNAVEGEIDSMLERGNVLVVNVPEIEERLRVGSSVDVELASGKLWLGKTDTLEAEVCRDELRDASEARLPEVGLLEATPEGETRIDELRPDASDVGMSREELDVSRVLEPPVALASRELTKAATSTTDEDDELLRTEERLLLGLSLARKDRLELSSGLTELEEAKSEDAVGVRMDGVMVGVLLSDGIEMDVLIGEEERSALLGISEETTLLSELALERADVWGVGGVEVVFVVPGTCETSATLLIKIDELVGNEVGREDEIVERIGISELVLVLSLVGIARLASLLETSLLKTPLLKRTLLVGTRAEDSGVGVGVEVGVEIGSWLRLENTEGSMLDETGGSADTD